MLDLNDPLNNIRVYIKIRRKQLKLTQLELSKKSGVGIRFLRELEQGRKTNFNTEPIIKVLSLLGNGKLTISI
jgi:transcriptional regulator with XRE-family HTH domain